ncbi:MAG: PAS domain S-box protein [Chloroflexaceae bacterium]
MTVDEHALAALQVENARLRQQLADRDQQLQTVTDVYEHLRTHAHLLVHDPRSPNVDTYLQMIISHTPILLYAFDRNGIFTLSEGKGLDVLGLQPGQVVGMSVFDLYHDQPQVLVALQRALAGETFSTLLEGTTGDGQTVAFEARYTPMRDATGQVSEVIGVAFDVTEQLRAQREVARSYDQLEALVDQRTAELVESQALLRETQRTAQIGGWSFDLHTEQIRWTEEMYRLYDLPHDTPLSVERALAAYTDEARMQFQHAYRRLITDGIPYDLELPFVTAAGTHRWVRAEVKAMTQQEQIIGIFGTLQDITKRKQAEESLHANHHLLQTLMDHIPATVFVKDTSLRYLLVNSYFAHLAGVTIDQMIGRTNTEVVDYLEAQGRIGSVGDLQMIRQIIATWYQEDQDVLMNGRIIETEETAPVAGELHSFIAYKFPISNQYGDIIGLGGISLDITARKQTEEALRTSEARYRLLFEASLDGIVVTDSAGHYHEVNPAACAILGYDRATLLRMSVGDLAVPDGAVPAQQQFAAYAGTGSRQDAFSFVRADGSVRIVEFSARQISAERHMSIIRDITERKHAEEAYHTLVEHSLQGLVIIQDQRFVFANPAMAAMLGYHRDELLQFTSAEAWQTVHPDDRDMVMHHMRARMAGQAAPSRYEVRLMRKDGSLCWAEVFVSSTTYRGNAALQIAYNDSTARKQAEAALHASEQFVQQIAAAMPGVLYIYDLILERNVYSNRQMWHILGYTAKEIQAMGSTILPTLLHPDDTLRAQRHRAHMQQAQANEETVFTFEYRMRHRDGTWRWLLSYEIIFTRTSDGQVEQILGIAQDITARKQAEVALHASEARFRSLVDHLPKSAVFLVDHELRFLVARGQGLSAMGWHPDLLEGKRLHACLPPAVATTVVPLYQAALAGTSPAELEQTWEGQTYQLRPVSLQDQYGQIVGAMILAQDITARKQAEETLHQYRRMVAATPDVMLLMNRDYIYQTVNDAYTRYHAKTYDEIVGHSVAETFGQDQFEGTMKGYLDRCLRGETVHYQAWFTYAGVGQRFMDVTYTPYRDDPGVIVGVLVSARDMTAMKQTEETLHQYRRMVSMTPDLMALIHREYIYHMVNDAYTRYHAKPYDDIIGHSVADIVGKTRFQHMKKSYLDRCLQGETVHYQAWFTYAGVGQRFMDVTYTPYRDDTGVIVGVLVNARDITTIKQAQEDIQVLNDNLQQRNADLEALNHELEMFGYAIAHHLRSPLWTVRLCADAMYEEYGHVLDGDGHTVVQTMRTTVVQMNETIARLLTMATLSREQITREPMNLSALVQEIAADLRWRDPARHVIYDIMPEVFAAGDVRLVRMLLENLLENAWKYTGPRSPARISFTVQAHPATHAPVYVVRDNGVGFDQPHADALFQAFRRLHAVSEFPGTGIGLAIVRRIVQLHGGEVWATSTRDHGAAFFFTLG